MSDLGYLWKMLTGLPLWIRILFYCLVSLVVVAVAGYFGWKSAAVAAGIMLLIGLLLILLSIAGGWVRDRRAAELRGDFSGVLGTPALAPDARERIEDVDFDFGAGLARFKDARRDVYDLPWFLVVGEDMGGKSTLIKNSGIDLALPQGPDLSGGRRRAVEWWFTNFAVLVEAAGDLVFGPASSRGGTTEPWSALADRLARARRVCPVNGIILTIPATGLLSDSPQEVERKAGILARHLDTLRQRLEIAVPVWVMVTRCDSLEGFVPYFDNFSSPESRNQMMGWSNPAAWEAPFRPELADEGLQLMIQRLRRRRLGYLADPAPRTPSSRRADEVDILFRLPDSLEALFPALRIYLENLFVVGQWSALPLPLRGVYFCSAGDSPQPSSTSLPAPTSFFIRDTLLDKVFREDGLVSRCGMGSRENVRRRLLTFWMGLAGIIALLALAVLSFRELGTAQSTQLPLWNYAAKDWEPDGWSPVLEQVTAEPPTFSYLGEKSTGLSLPKPRGSGEIPTLSLSGFHENIAYYAARPLGVPWLFRPFTFIGTNPDSARAPAQRTLFEQSVVEPLLTATRIKMARPLSPTDDLDELEDLLGREARALTELVRVEVDIVRRKLGETTSQPGSTFIPSLLGYTCDVRSAPGLVTVMNWTYGSSQAGRGRWAPSWTSGGNSLLQNPAISQGIDRLVTYARERIAELERNLAALQELAVTVQAYSDAESQLAKVASIRDDPATSESLVTNSFETLEAAKIRMEEQINVTASLGLFEDGPQTLSSALANLSSGKDSHLGQVDQILLLVQSVLPPDDQKIPATGPTPAPTAGLHVRFGVGREDLRLMREIRDRLTGISGIIRKNIDEKINDKLRSDYASLDRGILQPYSDQPSYLWRWKEYGRCAAGAPTYHFTSDMYLVDQRWSQLKDLLTALGQLQVEVDRYTGPRAAEFLAISGYLINRARTIQISKFTDAYLSQARGALLRVARFPLVFPPGPDNEALSPGQLQGAAAVIAAVAADLDDQTFKDLPQTAKQPLTDFATQIAPLQAVVAALIKPDGSMASVNVSLYNGQAQRQLSGPNLAPMPTPTPTPTPPPRSLLSKVFGGAQPTPDSGPTSVFDNLNWNAISLVTSSPGALFPLNSPSDISFGTFPIQDGFSFQVYHSLSGQGGSEMVTGGTNWSALRLIARLGGKPIGAGQDWQVALKPNEPLAVWIKLSFDQPLPPIPWPTAESLGLKKGLLVPTSPIPQDPSLDPLFGL